MEIPYRVVNKNRLKKSKFEEALMPICIRTSNKQALAEN